MIKSQERFDQARPAGFDGVFEWDFLRGAFGSKIMPMDFDCVVERKGNFLLFETKEPGKDVPVGQMITLEAAYKTGHFTIIFIYGKTVETIESYSLWGLTGKTEIKPCSSEKIRRISTRWFEYANANPKSKIDISFLNRRVETLDKQITTVKYQIETIVKILGGEIIWGSK